MPEVRALRSFKGRYGHIRAGQTFTAEPSYAAQLLRSKLIEVVGEPGPAKDRSIPEAPGRAGKGDAGGQNAPRTAPQPPAAGKGITSASLPAGPASRKKTSKKSAAGARRGTPTSRKAKPASEAGPADV